MKRNMHTLADSSAIIGTLLVLFYIALVPKPDTPYNIDIPVSLVILFWIGLILWLGGTILLAWLQILKRSKGGKPS
jgi:hypothetical protein